MEMTVRVEANTQQDELKTLIQRHSVALATQLQAHHLSIFPPNAEKGIRSFSPAEAAKFVGITEGYLRQVAAELPGVSNVSSGGRRSYSVEAIHEIRKHLDAGSRSSRRYLPWRTDDEQLQVITVMNFKGGSGKTTTTSHLAQYLALRGYRVLAIDLDPQASLSALFGHQPELDVGPNETLYGAIRYDDSKRPIAEIVRATYIPDLHLIPGNLELMEFEHDTPKALMTRAPGDTLFFARIGQALAQVQKLYDVVVIDCPPQLGFLTMSALTAATSVLITVHPQMLDVMSDAVTAAPWFKGKLPVFRGEPSDISLDIRTLRKDMMSAIATGACNGVAMPATSGAMASLAAAVAGGWGDKDLAEVPQFFRSYMLQDYE